MIVLARQVHADALLIDEKVGPGVGQRAGLSVVGLFGVLAEAKIGGILPAVGAVIDRLVDDAGFYVPPELRAKILQRAGEL